MPLPKPRTNESRTDFVQRCIINPEVVAEFGTQAQRVAVCYDLYTNKATTKATDKEAKEWQADFESELDKAEEKEIVPIRRYYQREFYKSVDEYIATGKTNYWNGYFKEVELAALYSVLYRNVGDRFSKFYYNRFTGKYPNEFNVSSYNSIWRQKFSEAGLKIAQYKGQGVSLSSQQEIVRVLNKFHKVPEFQALNEREASKILRNQFKNIADWKARRIVRTEATNAANFATLQTATDMYGSDNIVKQWIAALDTRTRDAHAAANGQIAIGNEKFKVGGEELSHPGSGSIASNNVNCRCSIITTPRQVSII